MGKTVGPRFVQVISKTSRIGNSVQDCRIPFVQFTLIYRQSGTSLTIGKGPATGRKKMIGTKFSVRVFRLGIFDYLSRRSVYSGRANQNSLTIYISTEISDIFFVSGEHSKFL